MRRRRLLFTVLALLALTPSAMGHGYASAVHAAARGSLAVRPIAAPSFAPERARIAGLLVDLGYTPDDAHAAAALLQPEDLIVLLENPRMMQRAGELNNLHTSYIIGGLIVAGIVALAVAGNGSVQIN